MKFLVLLASLMGLASATNSSTNETETNATTSTPQHTTSVDNTTNGTTTNAVPPTVDVNGTTSTTTTPTTPTTPTATTSSGNSTENSTTTTTTTAMAAGIVMTSSVSLRVPFATDALGCVSPFNTDMKKTIARAYFDQTNVDASTSTVGCNRRQLSTRQLASHMSAVTFKTVQTYTDTAAAAAGTTILTATSSGLLHSVDNFKAALTTAALALAGSTTSDITGLVSNITAEGFSVTPPTDTAASTTSSAAATGVATALFSVLGLTALLA